MTESGPRSRWNPVAVSLARRTFGLMVFVLGLTTLNTQACAAQGGNGDVTVRVYERANHLFIPVTTGLPSEYAALEKTFLPGLLDDIFDWLSARVAR